MFTDSCPILRGERLDFLLATIFNQSAPCNQGYGCGLRLHTANILSQNFWAVPPQVYQAVSHNPPPQWCFKSPVVQWAWKHTLFRFLQLKWLRSQFTSNRWSEITSSSNILSIRNQIMGRKQIASDDCIRQRMQFTSKCARSPHPSSLFAKMWMSSWGETFSAVSWFWYAILPHTHTHTTWWYFAIAGKHFKASSTPVQTLRKVVYHLFFIWFEPDQD